MLYNSNTDLVSLEKELDYLKDYISLQQLRLKNPKFTELNIYGNTGTKKVTPLLFIPFIENAYKHGRKDVKVPGIIIDFKIESEYIFFRIENYTNSNSAKPIENEEGFGLPNIKRRLELLYPEKYVLRVIEKDCKFIVELEITLNKYEN